MAYHHGDLRRALLDATLALADEKGAATVTLREVAGLAGVSQTAPYRHFADKTAMLAAASEEGFVLLREMMIEASLPTEPRARVIALGVTYVEFAVSHRSHFRLMFGQGSPAKATQKGLQARARDLFQLVLAAVTEWQPRRDARSATIQIWALCHGMANLTIERQLGMTAALASSSTRSALAALLDGLSA
jgi:AcrR family transcriptional regulator